MARSQEFIQGELDALMDAAPNAAPEFVAEYAIVMLAQQDIGNRERNRARLLEEVPGIDVEKFDQALEAQLQARPFDDYIPDDDDRTTTLPAQGFGEAPSSSSRAEEQNWVPFPTGVLPASAAEFVRKASSALQCDESMVAVPALAVAAGSIGNRRHTSLKHSWTEAGCVWAAVVAESGSRKTPAIKEVTLPLREHEADELAAYRRNCDQHKADELAWRDITPASGRGPRPEPPPEPKRLLVNDATVEALVPILQANPGGLLLYMDELAGLFSGFDQYKGGRGNDSQHFLQMWSGGAIINDRKNHAPMSVKNALLSVVGGIQPEILTRAVSHAHIENGMASRFLLCMPPERVARWSADEDISLRIRAGWAKTLKQLRELELGPDGSPVLLPLTPDAEKVWAIFHNDCEERKRHSTGAYRYSVAKLQGYCARIALTLQLLEDHKATSINTLAMERAVALMDWFRHEARRVYGRLTESNGERHLRELAEWLVSRGKPVTARDVTRGLRRYQVRGGSETANLHLHELTEEGVVVKQERPSSTGTWEYFIKPAEQETEL